MELCTLQKVLKCFFSLCSIVTIVSSCEAAVLLVVAQLLLLVS